MVHRLNGFLLDTLFVSKLIDQLAEPSIKVRPRVGEAE